jgi:hypothetical protein
MWTPIPKNLLQSVKTKGDMGFGSFFDASFQMFRVTGRGEEFLAE